MGCCCGRFFMDQRAGSKGKPTPALRATPPERGFYGFGSETMLLLAFLLLFSACDLSDLNESNPLTECTKIGAQCQLPDGPLGVCLSAPCAEDQTQPCFVCTSQH